MPNAEEVYIAKEPTINCNMFIIKYAMIIIIITVIIENNVVTNPV